MTPHLEALRAELEHVLAQALEGTQQVLDVFASHDLALPALREHAATHGLHIGLRFAGSVDALRALAEGRCTVAGFHVPALQQGSPVFARALKPVLRPGWHKLIGCWSRRQGLMVRPPRPRGLSKLGDLAGTPLRFVNRQAGSGTRLLMDHLLRQDGLRATQIAGYLDTPEESHLAVAAAVAGGAADVGPGVEAAAREFGLDFVPLVEEDYYLVCLKQALESDALRRLREMLASADWLARLAALPGYTPARPGQVLSLTKALPWWHFRAAKSGARMR
jgi:putative molybdopterin biosynthesis protein